MPAELAIPYGSVEYVKAPITADVNLDMTVDLSIVPLGGPYVWQAGTWLGDPGTTRTVRTTSPVEFSTAAYPSRYVAVHARLTDTPEAPVIYCGRITLTA